MAKLVYYLRVIDRLLGSLVLLLMVAVVVFQVILRALATVVTMPTIDTIELAQYFLIFIVFVSAAYTARKGEHIAMLEFKEKLPAKVRLVIDVLVYAVATVVFGLIFYSALRSIIINYQSVTPALGIPFPIFFFPTAFGFLLLTIEYGLKTLCLLLSKNLRLQEIFALQPKGD